MIYNRIDAQCYVKKSYSPLFEKGTQPALRYICNITPEASSVQSRVMHAHDDLVELVLIYSGESEYLIGHKKVPVRAGDLLIYNCGVVHDESPVPGTRLGFYCAGIGGLKLPDMPENTLCTKEDGYVFHAGGRYEELRFMFDMLFQNLVSGEPDAERFCDHMLLALLDKVMNVIRDPMSDTRGREGEKNEEEPSAMSHRIKKYIDDHYTEPLSLNKIASDLHLSPWYLSYLFKEMTGYSPIQYLLRRRIGEAQTLLISTDLSITEIAFRVGYDTQSYFNAQFTKHVGMPPKQFRKNYIVGK